MANDSTYWRLLGMVKIVDMLAGIQLARIC
jgi:hypothetical protein